MKESKLSGETIFKGKVITVVKDEVICDNGNKSIREVVRHNGGSAILGIDENNDIIFIKQYRYAIDKIIYELPAGKIEIDEDPLVCAIREFEEETGYKPTEMKFINYMYPTPGYSNEKIYLYYTENFIKGNTNFDDDEDISIEYISLSKALEMIENGEIKDAKTIACIMGYLLVKKLVK